MFWNKSEEKPSEEPEKQKKSKSKDNLNHIDAGLSMLTIV